MTFAAVVLDAADLGAESSFWHRFLGGTIQKKASYHILQAEGWPVMAIQFKPDHVAPEWPDGQPQQIHFDITVDDIAEADRLALAAGARRLNPPEDVDPSSTSGFRVYADPAGHPFCLTWG